MPPYVTFGKPITSIHKTEEATEQLQTKLLRLAGETIGEYGLIKDGDKIYHSYSTYTRGLDMLNVAYHYMDLVPKGRDEGDGGPGTWLRRHDEYPD